MLSSIFAFQQKEIRRSDVHQSAKTGLHRREGYHACPTGQHELRAQREQKDTRHDHVRPGDCGGDELRARRGPTVAERERAGARAHPEQVAQSLFVQTGFYFVVLERGDGVQGVQRSDRRARVYAKHNRQENQSAHHKVRDTPTAFVSRVQDKSAQPRRRTQIGSSVAVRICGHGERKGPPRKKAEDPDYAIQHNLKLDRLYYLEHSLMKPVESLFELFVPNPNELFDEMIKEYKIANGLTIKKTKVERELEKLNRVVEIKYCKGFLKNGTQCTSKVKGDAIFCGRHNK